MLLLLTIGIQAYLIYLLFNKYEHLVILIKQQDKLINSILITTRIQAQFSKQLIKELNENEDKIKEITSEVNQNRTRQIAVRMYKNGLDINKIKDRYRLSKNELDLIRSLYEEPTVGTKTNIIKSNHL